MSTEQISAVVVGYDGSPEGTRALDWAAVEARARALPLTVIHAWDVYIGSPVAMPMVDLGAVAQQTLDGGLEHLRKEAPDVPVRGVLVAGQAAAKLIEAGKSADLIVLGPRGLGGFAGLVLGSVSAQVVAHAPCPVVVVRGDLDGQRGQGRVVVGVDGSPASGTALAMAFAEAEIGRASPEISATAPASMSGPDTPGRPRKSRIGRPAVPRPPPATRLIAARPPPVHAALPSPARASQRAEAPRPAPAYCPPFLMP